MKTLVMTRVFNTLRQKLKKLLTPEFILLIYTLVSWLTRLSLNYFLPKFFNGSSTVTITFPVSVGITIFFIWISHIQKIDWYGRKQVGPIARIIKYCYEKNWIKSLIRILFFMDPFLFYIYFKNGHNEKIHYWIAWILLMLSLFVTSLAWMGFGFLIKFIT